MQFLKKSILILMLLSFGVFNPVLSSGWDGIDSEVVREGEDIEYYDSESGEYKDVEVESIERYGGTVEVEVYDYETGEYKTLEMDSE
jgi:hypothetical protein